MRIKKFPLADRLAFLSQGEAYPERTAVIVQRIADMPIASYMAGCIDELDRLGAVLELTEEQISGMTYADVAARVSEWYTSYTADEPQRHIAALRAVELLAAPLLLEYQMYRWDSDDGDNGNNSDDGGDGDFEED